MCPQVDVDQHACPQVRLLVKRHADPHIPACLPRMWGVWRVRCVVCGACHTTVSACLVAKFTATKALVPLETIYLHKKLVDDSMRVDSGTAEFKLRKKPRPAAADAIVVYKGLKPTITEMGLDCVFIRIRVVFCTQHLRVLGCKTYLTSRFLAPF